VSIAADEIFEANSRDVAVLVIDDDGSPWTDSHTRPFLMDEKRDITNASPAGTNSRQFTSCLREFAEKLAVR
jgi:hypothetical protein